MLLRNRFWKTHFNGEPADRGPEPPPEQHVLIRWSACFHRASPGSTLLTSLFLLSVAPILIATALSSQVIGRLKDGMSLQAAQADVQAVASSLANALSQGRQRHGHRLPPRQTRGWLMATCAANSGSAWCRGIPSADCLREPRQPSVGQSYGAARVRSLFASRWAPAAHASFAWCSLNRSCLVFTGAIFGILLPCDGRSRRYQELPILAASLALTKSGINPWVLGVHAAGRPC